MKKDKESPENLNEPLVHNHLEDRKGLSIKSFLIKNLKAYYKTNKEAVNAGFNVFDITPTTYVIQSKTEGRIEVNGFDYVSELASFKAKFREL